MSRNTGSFLLGAIIGGTAGAVAALLFAPKSGRELRDDLNQQANVIRDTALDYADIMSEKGNAVTKQLLKLRKISV
ncbi:YtxH domain-containing protein [Aerococcus sp. 1KP-2016]|uniref:YtxH domain-containing protein n=1 Tax=Aerococcus sp. 1KP-2016 TaxID=1981982 RepID=UPI001F3F8D81|nr:YtxH domain-containing protein [Aerococcus sp. 1KP-2016]